jgi:hypothetical protein
VPVAEKSTCYNQTIEEWKHSKSPFAAFSECFRDVRWLAFGELA